MEWSGGVAPVVGFGQQVDIRVDGYGARWWVMVALGVLVVVRSQHKLRLLREDRKTGVGARSHQRKRKYSG